MITEPTGVFRQDFEPINPIRTQAEKITKFIWENLSDEERKVGGRDVQAQLLGFALNIKPAIFLGKIDEPTIVSAEPIIDFLSTNGIDAMIYGPFLINRKLLLDRIKNELDFAKELGWEEGMSLEDFLAKTSPYERNVLGEIRTGFILGFPQSAIRAFGENRISPKHELIIPIDIEGPTGGRVYFFSTAKSAEHAPDLEDLKKRVGVVFDHAGYVKK
jgi:hypothetical protein